MQITTYSPSGRRHRENRATGPELPAPPMGPKPFDRQSALDGYLAAALAGR